MWTVLGSLTLWCGELQQASTAGQMSILDGTLLFLIGKEKERHHFVVLQTAHPLLFLGPPPCPLYMEGSPSIWGMTRCRGAEWDLAREQFRAAHSHAAGAASRALCRLSSTCCFSRCSLEVASTSLLFVFTLAAPGLLSLWTLEVRGPQSSSAEPPSPSPGP